MLRALFEKTGNAVWISHLDLMRVFQRAFQRAGLPLTHTQGFNPRPSVSIALPMSVGVSSGCELLDFQLEGKLPSREEIRDRLNRALISGVRVREVYDTGSKIKNLAYLDCCLHMEYDRGIPAGAEEAIKALFRRDSLPVEKRSKNGVAEQDILPMILRLDVAQEEACTLCLSARVCCQNPSLNPMQLGSAIGRYLPEMAPDFIRCCRLEVLDTNQEVFR